MMNFDNGPQARREQKRPAARRRAPKAIDRVEPDGTGNRVLLDYRAGRWQWIDIEYGADIQQALVVDATDMRLLISVAALSEMLVARLLDLRSFDQQSAAISAAGRPLSRGQLSKLANQAAALLAPVGDALARTGLRASVLSSANISMSIAGEQGRRLWLFMANPPRASDDAASRPLMWLKLTPDRCGGFVTKELAEFRGVLQAPAFAGYDRLALRHTISLADCWRQLEDETRMIQMVAPHPYLVELTRFFPRLRETEARIAAVPAHVREAVRQQELQPLLERLSEQLEKLVGQVNAGAPLGAFANDLRSRWPALVAFLKDGRISCENAALQRIRLLGAHSRRWVFGRHEESRKGAALLYAIVGTCELNGGDPRAYLGRTLARLMTREIVTDVESLMPWPPPRPGAALTSQKGANDSAHTNV